MSLFSTPHFPNPGDLFFVVLWRAPDDILISGSRGDHLGCAGRLQIPGRNEMRFMSPACHANHREGWMFAVLLLWRVISILCSSLHYNQLYNFCGPITSRERILVHFWKCLVKNGVLGEPPAAWRQWGNADRILGTLSGGVSTSRLVDSPICENKNRLDLLNSWDVLGIVLFDPHSSPFGYCLLFFDFYW